MVFPMMMKRSTMVYVAAGHHDRWWFGVAWTGTDLVATASGSSREEALRSVSNCVPRGVAIRPAEDISTFVTDLVPLLAALERGEDVKIQFRLSEYLSPPLRRILNVASKIPVGYVTSYGNIAGAASTEARAVGRVMATNPLYPIVACHRVVGSDMLLVGYGGKQDEAALAAKLARLEAEAKGAPRNRDIPIGESFLTVYPVERVLEAVAERSLRDQQKAKRQAENDAADRLQLPLF